MGKATLVVMAAGIGSRFGGGIKQLEPVGPNGEIILDYAIYDALQAGFDKVVFVIRKSLEQDFKEKIGNKVGHVVDVEYVYQELEDIPEQFQGKFKERKKPWGTGQAILCCKDVVQEPFLVINADDYYGKQAYKKAYQYLTEENVNAECEFCMISFILKNTLSDNGGVTRGVCNVNEEEMLVNIMETHNIEKRDGRAVVCTEQGEWELALESAVSMNMWGMTPVIFEILETGFEQFLDSLEAGDIKSEYLLPTIIGDLLMHDRIQVKVLQSEDKWVGVTYKEDRKTVIEEIGKLVEAGMYPASIYQEN